MKTIKYFIVVLVSSVLFSLTGCTDDYHTSSSPNFKLGFSEDTISFDTVFTTIGTPTNQLVIYNKNKYGIKFDAYLAGGNGSPFKINMDGNSGTTFSDMEIRDNDSAYCFISATLKQQHIAAPTPVTDSLIFILESGIQQQVQIIAYGQDVIILKGKTITSDTLFTSEYPFYIYDSLVVAADAELKIAAGSKLHFHKNAGLTVKGKITAIGNNDSIIEFRGGRTDNLFDDLPYDQLSDQWRGIHLTTESFGNNFEFCDIRNGKYGIKADSSNVEELKIAVLSSKIQNTTGHLLELNNCYTTFGNSLIVNAGGNCININGGRHNFTFCTIANFYLWGSRSESVAITNKGNKHPYPLQNAEFTNCIITGTSRNEFATSLSDSINGDTIAVADYKISHSLVLTSDTTNKAFEKCVFDNPENPIWGIKQFKHIADGDYSYNFKLDSLSTARGIADNIYVQHFTTDINGRTRPMDAPSDAGCYQSE